MALALFALIGAAGFTLLDGVLRAQSATESRLDRLAEIQRALLVVSTDLDQITGGLAGSDSTLTFQKDDLSGSRIIVRYELSETTLVRTVSGPGGERVQTLVQDVATVRWTFRRHAGDWLEAWPVTPVGGTAPTPVSPAIPSSGEGVVAVALDVTLDGFDGRPGATLRRVASVPLMRGG